MMLDVEGRDQGDVQMIAAKITLGHASHLLSTLESEFTESCVHI